MSYSLISSTPVASTLTVVLPQGITNPTEEQRAMIRNLSLDPLLSCFSVFFVNGSDETSGGRSTFSCAARIADLFIDKLKTQEPSLDTEDRFALRSIFGHIFEPMGTYLKNVYVHNQEFLKPRLSGVKIVDMVWLSLHLYLLATEITRENVQAYVDQLVAGTRPTIQCDQVKDYSDDYYRNGDFMYVPKYSYSFATPAKAAAPAGSWALSSRALPAPAAQEVKNETSGYEELREPRWWFYDDNTPAFWGWRDPAPTAVGSSRAAATVNSEVSVDRHWPVPSWYRLTLE